MHNPALANLNSCWDRPRLGPARYATKASGSHSSQKRTWRPLRIPLLGGSEVAGIVFPVSTVYDVINYVAAWNNVPADVPSVALPPDLPRPLRDLHVKFGLLGTRAIRVQRRRGGDLDWQEGIFVNQDFLVPASYFPKSTFIAKNGDFEGQRLLTFVHENQDCWNLHVPLNADDDPPVLMSEDREAMHGCQRVADKLSEFLAVVVLRETVMGSPFLWSRGGELNLSRFKLGLKPLLIGASYVYPELRHDFYIDGTGAVLVMHEPNCDNTWIASLSSNLDSIVHDRADVHQINPR